MQVANPAQVVVVAPAMHRAAVISHHEVVLAPAMIVYELALGRVRDQFVDERAPGRRPFREYVRCYSVVGIDAAIEREVKRKKAKHLTRQSKRRSHNCLAAKWELQTSGWTRGFESATA
jgi:hypothetical protein